MEEQEAVIKSILEDIKEQARIREKDKNYLEEIKLQEWRKKVHKKENRGKQKKKY